jgi:hypothetical protein
MSCPVLAGTSRREPERNEKALASVSVTLMRLSMESALGSIDWAVSARSAPHVRRAVMARMIGGFMGIGYVLLRHLPHGEAETTTTVLRQENNI